MQARIFEAGRQIERFAEQPLGIAQGPEIRCDFAEHADCGDILGAALKHAPQHLFRGHIVLAKHGFAGGGQLRIVAGFHDCRHFGVVRRSILPEPTKRRAKQPIRVGAVRSESERVACTFGGLRRVRWQQLATFGEESRQVLLKIGCCDHARSA